MKLLNGLLTVLVCVAAISAQENYSQWSGYRAVTLNTTASGANVASNVSRFPILVRLTSAQADVFSGSVGRGADLRFAKSNGVHLPYQIERWDSAGKAAEIWVLADTVKGNNGAQFLLMYWGKSGVADSSKGASVFDTANGFQGVWHMSEATGATALDATRNAFGAVPNGSPTLAPSAIGNGKNFDGSSACYIVSNSATGKLDFPEYGSYSISAWVTTNVVDGQHHEIVSKNDYQYALKLYNANEWEFFEFNGGGGWNGVRTYADAGIWRLLTGVRDGGNMSLYVDGVLATASIVNTSNGSGRVTNTDVSIGKWGDNSQRFWNGMIDEVNMSNVARGPDWVKLGFENQKLAQTLTIIGATGVIPSGVKRAGYRPEKDFGIRISGGGRFSLSLPDGDFAGLNLSMTDLRGKTVWNKTVVTLAQSNRQDVVWDAKTEEHPLPAGVYLVRLKLWDSNHKPAGSAEKTISYTP